MSHFNEDTKKAIRRSLTDAYLRMHRIICEATQDINDTVPGPRRDEKIRELSGLETRQSEIGQHLITDGMTEVELERLLVAQELGDAQIMEDLANRYRE